MRTAYLIVALSLVAVSLAAQSDALARAVERYRKAEGAPQRIAALEAIFKLGTSKVPAEDITRALARGLGDPLTDVRVRTVALVAAAPHRDTAMSALVGEYRRIAAVVKDFEMPELKDRSAEEMLEEIADLAREAAAVRKALEAVTDDIKTMKPLIHELSRIRDDRSVEGLALLLPVAGHGESGDQIISALMAFGTRPAVMALAAHVSELDKFVSAKKKQLAELRRERPGKMPKYWRGSAETWRDSEKKRIATRVGEAEAAVELERHRSKAFMEKIRVYARKRKLPAPPYGNSPSVWRSWGVRAGHDLPASVR